MNDFLGCRGFSPDLQEIEDVGLTPEESFASARLPFMSWLLAPLSHTPPEPSAINHQISSATHSASIVARIN